MLRLTLGGFKGTIGFNFYVRPVEMCKILNLRVSNWSFDRHFER